MQHTHTTLAGLILVVIDHCRTYFTDALSKLLSYLRALLIFHVSTTFFPVLVVGAAEAGTRATYSKTRRM